MKLRERSSAFFDITDENGISYSKINKLDYIPVRSKHRKLSEEFNRIADEIVESLGGIKE